MDYTTVEKYFIYRHRPELEEFDIDDPSTLDGRMFNAIQNSVIISLEDSAKYILEIFNTSYYLVTLILMEKRPILYVAKYLKKAARIGAENRHDTNSYHRYFQAMTMAIVCNYINVLRPNDLGWESNFRKNIWDHFNHKFYDKDWDGKARFLFFNNVLSDIERHSCFVRPEQFEPRKIMSAVEYGDFQSIKKDFKYIKERISLIPNEERFGAIQVTKKVIEETDDDYFKGVISPAGKEMLQDLDEMVEKLSTNKSNFQVQTQQNIYPEIPKLEARNNALEKGLAWDSEDENNEVYQDLQQQLNELKKKIEERDAEIKRLSHCLNEQFDVELEKENEKCLYNKVSFEFFLRLLEHVGLDINNTGNKTRAGHLWNMITGKSADDLRKYCSHRNQYNNNHTKEDIKRLNKHLSDMGISEIVL